MATTALATANRPLPLRGGLIAAAAGDAWIAGTVAAVLRAHGVRPAPTTAGTPVICDVSVGAGKPVSATA